MAGGMNRRTRPERTENLAERVAATRARQVGEPKQAAEIQPPLLKHAWYDGPYGRQAALLLGWRRIEDRFDGRICVATPDDGGWAIVEMWVDGAMLSPA
ncbi:hypothetical protein [Nocardioides sp.]|uniref:hypothetical protein n=1 Tax=Nocardioides sp. TaxID=35761 RepID=UPI0026319892|nr:hypothetical protein [Nocardioides sp.]MCW2738161.1 hypothetical protein [Nocardioides sp.]